MMTLKINFPLFPQNAAFFFYILNLHPPPPEPILEPIIQGEFCGAYLLSTSCLG